METIFNYNPSADLLDAIGVPQRNESDYLEALNTQTGQNRLQIRVLSDLQELFEYTDNGEQLARIEAELASLGAYATLFNE